MTAFTLSIPTYQCHKRVQALRIKAVVPNPRGYELHFEDDRFCPIEVSVKGVESYPEPGSYMVLKEGRMPTYVDAAAFEAGYTLVDGNDLTHQQVSAAVATRALSTFLREWPGGLPEVDAALASRDAEIERLRNALALAEGIAQRVIAETGFDESNVSDWRPVVRDALENARSAALAG